MTRVMIAEDSRTQAEQLRFILEGEGYEVEVAPDGDQALALFDKSDFDIVVSDIVMPGLSGYELCKAIKTESKARDTPVVLLSSLSDPMDIVRGLECGADNFVTKPYEPDQIVARLKTVLDNRRMRNASKLKMGIEVMFLGKTFVITSDKEQILDLLMSTFEDIVRTNRGLIDSKAELNDAKMEIERYARDLERRVEERTAEVRERTEQLHQSQKMEAVGQLTGGIAHDFNNLLSVMIGNLDLVQAQLSDRPEMKQTIEMALNAGLQGAELTKQLLAFSRKQQLRPQVIDLNKLVTRTSTLLRRTLGERVEIKTVSVDDLWRAEADSSQVESALINLSINARDAMPDGGQLVIETANKRLDSQYAAENADVAPGDYVMLAVTDTGTGIPPEVLPRVFEPFFTTKDVGKGTGLGLSMVYGFAKQSGGHLKIYSEVGHGTTVRLYLPRAKTVEREERISERPAEGATPPSETILVVEDNAAVRATVILLLTTLKYQVLEAENGREALAILERGDRIDLLFTDIVMPGDMSGTDLAVKARALRPDLKVLFTSGFTEASMRGGPTLSADDAILSKPYRRDELSAKIRDVLEGRKAT
jgi:signal transduction histidine kinase